MVIVTNATSSVRTFRTSLSCESRFPGHRDPPHLHRVWFHWGICVGSGVQIVWRRSVEAEHYHDAAVDPGCDLLHVLPAEPVRLGEGFQWSGTVRDDARFGAHLVRDQRAVEFRG